MNPSSLLLVVLATTTLGIVSAQSTVYWKADRCNTNFDNTNNWIGDNPVTGDPTAVSLGGPNQVPVAVRVESGTYKTGSELRLAANGLLILSSGDGETTIEFDEDASGSTAQFTGGQNPDAKECQFGCHENWQVQTASGFEDTLQPPCASQTAFLPWGSYHLQIPEDYNVRGIVFENQTTVTKDMPIVPEHQIDIGGALYLSGDIQNCIDEGLIDATTQSCFCQSTCPTDDQLAEQTEQQRDATKNAALDELEDIQKKITRNYNGVIENFPMPCLFPSGIDTLTKDAVTADLKATIAASIKTAYSTDSVSIGILDYTFIDADNTKLEISGVVTAETGSFLETIAGEVVDAWENTWSVSAFTPFSATKIESAILSALIPAHTACYEDRCAEVLPEKKATCGSDCVEERFVEVEDISAAGKLQSNLDKLQDRVQVQTLDLKEGVVIDSITLWQKFDGYTPSAAVMSYVDYVDQCGDWANDGEDWATSTPSIQTFQFDTAAILLNAGLPDSDIVRLGDSLNKGPLAEMVKGELVGKYGIISVLDDFEISLQRVVERRRVVSKPHLQLLGSYTQLALCTSNNQNLCPLKNPSERLTGLESFTNNLIATYDIITPPCVTLANEVDLNCASEQAKAAVAAKEQECGCTLSPTEAGALAKQTYLDIAKCGGKGTTPSGSCIDPSFEATAQIQATSIESQVAEAQTASSEGGDNGDKSTDKSSGSGGGLPIIPVVAGVAGGVILIIIITVLFMKSRGGASRGSVPSDHDRNVVAFENPMYDNPDNAGKQEQPQYEAAEDTGLYDEPSFTQSNIQKSNPLYDSAENLAGDDADYLGVGGEDNGYLDVAPDS